MVATVALLGREVLANHLLDRTYSGTIQGAPGGTVTFRIDGNGLVTFTHDLAGNCPPRTFPATTVSAATHTFQTSQGTSGVSNVSGSFPTVGTASGRLTSDPDGTACDATGVEWVAAAQATPTPTASPTPAPTVTPRPTLTPVPTRTPATTGKLPNNGAPTAVIALSGATLLEVGYGLRMISRRIQRPWLSVPAYLVRRLLSAEQKGADGVKVAGDWYLTRRRG